MSDPGARPNSSVSRSDNAKQLPQGGQDLEPSTCIVPRGPGKRSLVRGTR
jgi:hypothetical protein